VLWARCDDYRTREVIEGAIMPDGHQTRLSGFTEQIKEFREDDEARWKYLERENQRQLHIRRDAGDSDEHLKETLKRAGINVQALEVDSQNELKQQARVFAELRKIEPPPPRRGLASRILADQAIAPSDIDRNIYPPPFQAWGNTEECGFNLPLGEWNLKRDEVGEGWGLAATAGSGPQECTMMFYYFPPRAGELTVEPHVDFQGDVALRANDHWYTSTSVDMDLKLRFDLFQHYWDGEAVATIISEHHQNVHKAYWVDDHRVMSKSLSVSANDPVWIKLTCSLDVGAHSGYAHAACDFRTGSERRIRVEYIRIHMPGSRSDVLHL
jgi:hypothetical protein